MKERIQEEVAIAAARELIELFRAYAPETSLEMCGSVYWRAYAIVSASIQTYSELRRARKGKRKRRRPSLEPSLN